MSPPGGAPSGSEVTVVVCAYNAATTIDTALASVAGQTVQPYAVVIVDDGSTDNTAERTEGWSERLPIHLVRSGVNTGLGRARPLAIGNTETPLIAILDADDAWLPDHLEVILSTYARSPGLVTAQELAWAPGRAIRASWARRKPVPEPAHQLRAIIKDNFVFSGVLFARIDCERVGGYRDVRIGEDWDLWVRMIRHGIIVTRTDHPTCLYRVSPGSLSYGHRTAGAHVELMARVVTEAQTKRERRWARRGLRSRRAALAIAEAIACARVGDRRGARRAASQALATRRRFLRAIGLLSAPKLATALRDRRASARLGG